MKKYILILLLVFSAKYSSAQNYIPIPMDSAAWRVEWGCSFCNNCHLELVYKTAGDTVINSSTYVKINKEYLGGSCLCSSCPFDGFGYSGAIRQDTIQKKVYIVQPDSIIEKIVYDFSQTIGDTLNSILSFCGPEIIIGDDSILIGSTYHRRLTLSSNCNWFPIEFIEGIGSTKGLLEKLVGFEYGGVLICATYNNQIIYSDTSTICDVTVNINEINDQIQPTVSPNPFKDYFEIEFLHSVNNLKFSLYNVLGKHVVSIEEKQIEKLKIHRNDLPAGIYFYQIVSENKIISSGKLVAE